MSPTRVVLDGTALSGFAGGRGVGRYVEGLLGALDHRPGLEVATLVTDASRVPAGIEVRRVRRRASGRLAPYEQDLLLPLGLRGADVAHEPAPEPPRACALPYVQTLHDVFPLVQPESVTPAETRRWRWYARRYRRAAAVVAVSRFSADQGIRHLGLDPSRVHVALSAPHDSFRAIAPSEPADPPYLLMVSEFSPRKGYAEAFAVVDRLADLGYPHRLLVTGRLVPWTEPQVRALVAAAEHPDRIVLTGFVDDLPALYRGATAVLVTSRYEGYGFPAVEAMASGTPVVAFDNSALPEVVGDGGVLVPDGDVEAFAVALRPLLDDPGIRSEQVEAALARAAQLSWASVGDVHEAVYSAVHAGASS